MTKVRQFFGWVVAVLGAIIGFLLYWINLKNKNANALKAKIELANTQRKADIIETEIKHIRTNEKLLKKELDDLDKAEASLEKRREEIGKNQREKSPSEVEEYWKNH